MLQVADTRAPVWLHTLRRGAARTPNFDDAMPTGYVPRRTLPLSHKGMSDVTDKLGHLMHIDRLLKSLAEQFLNRISDWRDMF